MSDKIKLSNNCGRDDTPAKCYKCCNRSVCQEEGIIDLEDKRVY